MTSYSGDHRIRSNPRPNTVSRHSTPLQMPTWSKFPCRITHPGNGLGALQGVMTEVFIYLLPYSIIFVHGITGHRERTWAAYGSRPWPETLLPTAIPQARILSFGYDADVVGWRPRLSGNRIGDHAKNLLSALAAHREADNTVRCH